MRRSTMLRPLAALFLVAVGCSSATGTNDDDKRHAQDVSSDPFFAISADYDSFNDAQAKALRGLGVGMVRLTVRAWPSGEAEFRRRLEIAEGHGLSVVAQINYETLADLPSDPIERQKFYHAGYSDSGNAFSTKFANVAAAIAETYRGRVRAYELWNEPNSNPIGGGDYAGCDATLAAGGAISEGTAGWIICPKELGVVLTNAYQAMRARDGYAWIVAGNMLSMGDRGAESHAYWRAVESSPAVTWHRSAKGRAPWDLVGYHPYAYDPDGDPSFDAEADALRGVMGEFGDGSKLAVTEIGWSTRAGADYYHRADDGAQGTHLRRVYEDARGRGDVAFVAWFNYLDVDAEGGYGIRRGGGAWKPSVWSYCAVTGSSCPLPPLPDFCTDNSFRRIQFANVALRYLYGGNHKSPPSGVSFWDMNDSVPQDRATAAEVQDLGLMHGYADGSFDPAAPIARVQLATVLVRLVHRDGSNHANGYVPTYDASAPLPYEDTGPGQLDDPGRGAIQQAMALGLMIDDRSEGRVRFHPLESATRRDAAMGINAIWMRERGDPKLPVTKNFFADVQGEWLGAREIEAMARYGVFNGIEGGCY